MIQMLTLSPAVLAQLAVIAFLAGLVRGFTGFALSAFALAIAVLLLPPVELIPVLWWLEITASLMMLRSGWGDADFRLALTLAVGSMVGLFFGLGLTLTIDPDLSRRVALVILIVLAGLQLARVRLSFVNSTAGTVATGLIAGLVTGLAGVGGMVVALFVLAREARPRVMRATLVVYLLLGTSVSFFTHLWYGTMNVTSASRGIALVAPCLIGVWLGARAFTPRFEKWYKPVCLWLLIGLALVSLMRSFAA